MKELQTKKPTPAQVLRTEYGTSPNFMTPKRLRIGWTRKGEEAYELSSGRGFEGETIYGVSLVRVVTTPAGVKGTERGDGKCCHSMREADEFIASRKGGK